jgi:hypothetical protein
MLTENTLKPDKDCFVRSLGVTSYYLCRSTDPLRVKCPYIKDYNCQGVYLCYHPDRHKFAQG